MYCESRVTIKRFQLSSVPCNGKISVFGSSGQLNGEISARVAVATFALVPPPPPTKATKSDPRGGCIPIFDAPGDIVIKKFVDIKQRVLYWRVV